MYDLVPCVISCIFLVSYTTGHPESNSAKDTGRGGCNPNVNPPPPPSNVKVPSHRKMGFLKVWILIITHTHVSNLFYIDTLGR